MIFPRFLDLGKSSEFNLHMIYMLYSAYDMNHMIWTISYGWHMIWLVYSPPGKIDTGKIDTFYSELNPNSTQTDWTALKFITKIQTISNDFKW